MRAGAQSSTLRPPGSSLNSLPLRASFGSALKLSRRALAQLPFPAQEERSHPGRWSWPQIWTFRCGKVERVEEDFDRTEALEAAGLSA
jgi:hypothetical protein